MRVKIRIVSSKMRNQLKKASCNTFVLTLLPMHVLIITGPVITTMLHTISINE